MGLGLATLAAVIIIYICLVMPKCTACGLSCKSTSGLTFHRTRCKILRERRAECVSHMVAADSAAAAAAAAATAPQPVTVPMPIPATDNETPVERPPSPVVSAPSPLPLRSDGRPQRRRRPPKRYQDDPPDPPSIVEPVRAPSPPSNDGEALPAPKWVKTTPNRFGVYKVYPHVPTRDPDASVSIDDLCNSSKLLYSTKIPAVPAATDPWFPFLSVTVARLMIWFHLGSNLKSVAELDSLIQNVVLQDDFDRAHLANFNTARENKRLDNATAADPAVPDGWKTASVKIKVPAPRVAVAENDAAVFEVPGLIYRDLLDVMIEAFQGPEFENFHTTPFEYRWDPQHDPDNPGPGTSSEPSSVPLDNNDLPRLPDGHEVMYSEVFSSERMLRAHNKLPQTETPHLETTIAAFMFWSDSTHLANFGNASLWPLYTFFGNLTKYIRAKPTSHAGHHQAYFPSLPDTIKDFYQRTFGVAPSTDIMAHLKRELMHACWDLLLTEEFIHAWVHGVVVKCYDGIERRIFPRIFTYGADYPEKVLLATIKYFGGCPCPRCTIQKSQIPDMGTANDTRRRQKTRSDSVWHRHVVETARRWIYQLGYLVSGAAVNRLLQKFSWVATRNAFSKLAQHGFDYFTMFVPDLLHEVELGGWKSLFTHLLRVVEAVNPLNLSYLDQRFRKIPIFGRSTIRRFHANASEMKKMAARDFEDLLQCALPVFEGLLPEPHNTIVLTLLFTFATWHAYAKLRLHTSSTIRSFRNVTTELGARARKFTDSTCKQYVTYELPGEYKRRARQQAKKTARAGGSVPSTSNSVAGAKKRKEWNLATYKWHSLGDYADTIVEIGTTDSYSTQIGELSHRLAKRLYAKTNKRKFERQIAAHERRQRLLRAIQQRLQDTPAQSDPSLTNTSATPLIPTERQPSTVLTPDEVILPRTPPRQHHHISESRRTWLHALDFPDEHPNDPALTNFLHNLKSHLLGRLLGKAYDGDETQFSEQDLADVNIIGERLYTHRFLRINYTSYDLRRDQDTLNPSTRPDFIVPAHEDEDENSAHPYWYGRILGIFHVDVRHVGERSLNKYKKHRMEFLWVRWFGRDMDSPGGWKYKRLHRIGFIDASEPDSGAIGFLDPAEVIRAVHLIPAFYYGRTTQLLGPSNFGRHFDPEDNEDYLFYYVNHFVDRDMFMRYSGDGSVGHKTRKTTVLEASVEDDAVPMDVDEEETPIDMNLTPDGVAVEGDGDGKSDSESDSDSDSDPEGEEGDEDVTGEDGDVVPGREETDEDLRDTVGYDDL